jgi:hypothetical protein
LSSLPGGLFITVDFCRITRAPDNCRRQKFYASIATRAPLLLRGFPPRKRFLLFLPELNHLFVRRIVICSLLAQSRRVNEGFFIASPDK